MKPNVELERFKEILRELAGRDPELPLGKAYYVALQIEETLERDMPAHPNDRTPVEVAAKWCRMQPSIVGETIAGRKIYAIKEARALSSTGPGGEAMGLKAAKEAVEYMEAHLLP